MSNSPWAIINNAAYGGKKNQQRYMKKQKFDTKSKTKTCGAPGCTFPGTTIKFGKETRILCKNHLQQLNAKHEKHEVTSDTFKKASEL